MREPYIRESYDGTSYMEVEVELFQYVIRHLQCAANVKPSFAQHQIGLVLGALRPYVCALNEHDASKQAQPESPDAEAYNTPTSCFERRVTASETPQ